MSTSKIEQAIEVLKQKRPIILVDSENRENEGDLVIPAENASAQIINFMISYCKGIVCVTVTNQLAQKIGLELLPRKNNINSSSPKFLTSIEAKYGITTGVSVYDRAHTIATLVKDDISAEDITTPGHVFPLLINEHGLSGRLGHTEASSTISQLAGFKPYSVICEVLKENGESAKFPELLLFSEKFNVPLVSIDELIIYMEKRDIKITF